MTIATHTFGASRRAIAGALAFTMVLALTVVAPNHRADAAEPETQALREGIAAALRSLAGIDTAEAILETIPLTPVALDEALSLPVFLNGVAALVEDTETTMADLVDGLTFDGPDDDGSITVTAAPTPGSVGLTIGFARDVTAPLVLLSDLVAYDAEALPLTATLDSQLTIGFDDSAPDLDLKVTLGDLTTGAEVGETYGPGNAPLTMNVGILAVDVAGEVAGSMALTAGTQLLGPIPLDDWTSTPAIELFEVAVDSATAAANLSLTSDLQGLGGTTGTISLDWTHEPGGSFNGWLDAVTIELGDLDDFRNIFLEEVVAGIAQLAVGLGATQLSGVADLQLPLLRERASELAHAGQGILDWMLDQTYTFTEGEREGEVIALATRETDGNIRLLEELDREALVLLGLTDLETILESLSDTLDEISDSAFDVPDLALAYDPPSKELTFALGWEVAPEDRILKFELPDAVKASTGLDNILPVPTAIVVDPKVTASLGIALDLTFDDARALLAEHDYDLDAAKADGLDPDDLIAITQRVKVLTDDTSVGIDLPVTGTVNLNAALGFVGLSATTELGAFTMAAEGDGPMVALAFNDGAETGKLTLTELVDGLVADAASTIVPSLDIEVDDFDLTLAAAVGGTTLEGTISLGATWNDLAAAPVFRVDTSDLGRLANFRFDDDPFALLDLLLQALDQLTAQLQQRIREGSSLGQLPIVDVDLDDLVAGLVEIREKIEQVAADPAQTLQAAADQLNCLLAEALGIGSCNPSAPPMIALELLGANDDSEPLTVALRLDLGVCGVPSGEIPPAGCVLNRPVEQSFKLDLADAISDPSLAAILKSIVGLSSDGQVDVDYNVTATLHAGVELPEVSPETFAVTGTPQAVLFDTTGVQGSVGANAATTIDVALGPLSAKAGKSGAPAVARLGAGFTLENTSGDDRIPIADLGSWASGLDLDVSESDDVTCPAGVLPNAEGDEPDRDAEGETAEVQACARLNLYLGDTWIGDIVFTAPDVTDPSGWNVHVPDDLKQRLLDALLDWRLLFDGIRYVVSKAATALDGARQGLRVPVVGGALDGGAEIANQLADALEQLAETIDTEGLTNASEVAGKLQEALDAAFDSLGAGDDAVTILLRCGTLPCSDGAPIANITSAEVTLDLGDDGEFTLPGFHLGFPGLSLNVDRAEEFAHLPEDERPDALRAGVEWGLDLTVGLEKSGFYLRTKAQGAGPNDWLQQLNVATTVDLPERMVGDLALLRVELEKLEDDAYSSEGTPAIGNRVHDLSLGIGTEVRAGTDGKLPLQQLLSLNSKTFVLEAEATADLRYGLATSASLPGVDTDTLFPTLLADLLLNWTFAVDSSDGFALPGSLAPNVLGFRDVRVDFSEFLGGFLKPILGEVRRFTEPFQPVIDTISTPIPGLSDLYELLTGDQITMLGLFEAVSSNDLTFIKRVIALVQLANSLGSVNPGEISLGKFDLNFTEVQKAPKPASQRASLIANKVQEVADGGAGLFATPEFTGASDAATAVTRSQGGGFSFPAFENPSQLFGMLVGDDPTLVRWDSGTLKAGFAVTYNFPPIFIGPVPIGFGLSASAQIAGRFVVGYDSFGIRRAVDVFNTLPNKASTSQALKGVELLFHGVFLEKNSGAPEIQLSATFAANGGVTIGIVSAGLEIGLKALINMDLRDTSGTGKVRIDQILKHIHTPICLFVVSGQLRVFLDAFVKISLVFVTKKFNFTIFDIVVLNLDDIFAELCAEEPPNLATPMAGPNGARVLVLNMGPRKGQRGIAKTVDEEDFVVRPLNTANTAFSVSAFGEYEEYHNITGVSAYGRNIKIVAHGGPGKDTIELLSGVATEVDDLDEIDNPDLDIIANEIRFTANAALCGGAGDDVLVGGRGNDLLIGDGSCTAAGGGASDVSIVVSLSENPPPDEGDPEPDDDGHDRLYGTAGNNLLFGLGGNDQLYGGTGRDLQVGGTGNDQLRGGDPTSGSTGDVLIGGILYNPPGSVGFGTHINSAGTLPNPAATFSPAAPGDDVLVGGVANDILIGDHGAVDTTGRVWADLIAGGTNFLDGGPGNDRLFGGPGADEIYGGPGNDFLAGGPGNDVLVGGAASSIPNPGLNILFGGPGSDTLVAHNATVDRPTETSITVTPVDGPATNSAVLLGGSPYDGEVPGNDVLWGSAGNDLGIGDNAQPPTNLRPTLEQVGSSILSLTYQAALGPGAFTALNARDSHGYPTGLEPLDIVGGNDRLYGGPGNDTLVGGPGADVLVGGYPVRRTHGQVSVATINPGSDLLTGGRGSDLLIGGHAEVSTSGSGASVAATLLPGAGVTSNRLIGGRWTTEPLTGSPGNDRILADRHGDVLVGDDGHITATGTTAATRTVTVMLNVGGLDELVGGAANDRQYGGPGNDVLRGNGGNDELEGGPGNDELHGGGGSDSLVGGSSRPGVPSGNNLLVGGSGNDALAGDNARIERVETGEGIHASGFLVELYDVALPGGPAPPANTAGADVLVGGALGTATNSSNLLFGQGGNDLAFGDSARRVADDDASAVARFGDIGLNSVWGRFVPIDTGLGGNDLVVGGPGDDALFGGPGLDGLVGGNSVHITGFTPARTVPSDAAVHVVPAVPASPSGEVTSLAGVASGNDLLVGGPGDDALAGDNARVERAAGGGIDGNLLVVELYDIAMAGAAAPTAATAGSDVLIGSSIGDPTFSSDDVLYSQGGDDLSFGDHATVVPVDDPDAEARYGDLGLNATWGRFTPVDTGSGGDDRLEGGAGNDVLFGGPGEDIIIGGSDRHQPFPGDWDGSAPEPSELAGAVAGSDVLVGGQDDDLLTGDNARVDRDHGGAFLGGFWIASAGSSLYDVALYDVAYAGGTAPHADTSGDDVVIGGSVGVADGPVGDAGDDVGFGQGDDDLLIGDDALLLPDARMFAPLLHASDGEDHLEGSSGNDVLFGNGGDDVLLGGSSDLAVPDAETNGVVAGSDIIVGGPGDDYGLGDNGRVELPAPWWASGVGGTSVTPFDEPIKDATPQPHTGTFGDDLMIGGSLRGNDLGLLGTQTSADFPGHDLFHGQGGDDVLFGDDVVVDVTTVAAWTAGWQALRPDLTQPMAAWPVATLDWLAADVPASGGDDLLLGGPDDDVIFGGPRQDDIIGGSWDVDRHDGRDLIDAGPGHDVASGDNATILRELDDDGLMTCQTYRHRPQGVDADPTLDPDVSLEPWRVATDNGADREFQCGVGTPDADPGEGVFTRVARVIEMLDEEPGVTSGSDLIWGNHGDDDLVGQFDDTQDFQAPPAGTWSSPTTWAAGDQGIPAWRVAEWCRLDAQFADPAIGGSTGASDMAEYLTVKGQQVEVALDINAIFFSGDVLCGGSGEDAMLGDQGVITNVVEDGAREEFIRPQSPFISTTIFREGTLTREVELTQMLIGGDDALLGGEDTDWMHGGAGDDLMNGNRGDDRMFGGDGSDAMWGGLGNDHLYGGHGNDFLDVKPRPARLTGNGKKVAQPPDPGTWFMLAVDGDTYDGIDHMYGGWDSDAMQADTAENGPVQGDRQIDWAGAYNIYYLCPATYGAWVSIRSIEPSLIGYLIDQAWGDGALDPATQGTTGFRELAMVYHPDVQQNSHPAHPETPGHFVC